MKQQGATYVVLLIALALMSLASATSLSAGYSMAQRDKELELLSIGRQFRAALLSYEQHSPTGAIQRPSELQQLLKDDRSGISRRHLRRLYIDPLTANDEWGVLRDNSGRITGVYSLAKGRPVKQDKFEAPFENFRGSEQYSKWVFSPYPLVRSD